MAGRAVAGTGSSQNRSVAGTGGSQQTSSAATSGGSGGYSYSYGGGGGGGRRGGGGGGGSSDQQKKTQAQLDNTGANYQKRKDDLDDITQKRKDDLEKIAKKRKAQMDDIAKRQLNNINQQRKANDAALSVNQKNIQKQIEWQPNQQKEQSTLMALRNRMGNSAYGSSIQDLAEGMGRVDDMNDVELINAWKQNENAAYSNWYQANQSLVADYNDQIASIKDEYSQFASDYSDQMSKMRADYNDELSQLNSQYWSTMSNVDPELASQENMEAAAANYNMLNSNRKIKGGQAVLDKLDMISKGKTGPSKSAAWKLAQKFINEAKGKSSNSGDLIKTGDGYKKAKGEKLDDEVMKKAKEAAEKAYTELKKKYGVNEVTNGKSGSDKYTLPDVNLAGRANLSSNLKINTSALGNLMKTQKNASAQDKLTKDFIRPDRGRGDVTLGSTAGKGRNGGAISKSTAANSGFSDNLAAFRRV